MTDVWQVKSGFVQEADIRTISRQIISIVTQVRRDREFKQQADAVKDTATRSGTVPAAQSVPIGGVTSSATSLPSAAAAAPAPATQQTRVAAPQQPAVSAAVTSPTAVFPPVPAPAAAPAPLTAVENTSSAQTNGLPVSSSAVAAPVAVTLPSVVTVAGQTSTVNTVTASVNVGATQPLQPMQTKSPSGLYVC